MYAIVPSIDPGLGKVRFRVDGRGICARIGFQSRGKLRQPEIKNLGVPALRDEDVRWLNIAMHDACGVSGIECVCDFDAQR
jgi:hypothetical protein